MMDRCTQKQVGYWRKEVHQAFYPIAVDASKKVQGTARKGEPLASHALLLQLFLGSSHHPLPSLSHFRRGHKERRAAPQKNRRLGGIIYALDGQLIVECPRVVCTPIDSLSRIAGVNLLAQLICTPSTYYGSHAMVERYRLSFLE
ncbi:unnamed protein product [Discosporangium mesarthrocarpum]